MDDKNFSITFQVDQSPKAVYDAITSPRQWWSEDIEGDTDRIGSIFYYHFQDIHRGTFKITELAPSKKVVWHVLSNYFSFVNDKTEWTGTDVVFEITEKDGKTELRFTHAGLVPQYECFEACSEGWGTYINGSLRSLIMTGKGQPNAGEAITESEKVLSQ